MVITQYKVTIGKIEHTVNFFVQIPTRLQRDSISNLIDQPGGCGVTRQISYTLLDQAGRVIDTDDTADEIISNYSGPEGLKPPETSPVTFTAGTLNDKVGYGTKTTDCPPPFTATATQNFILRTAATKSYSLSTTNLISMGRDSSGAKFVSVTITTP